MDHIEVLREKIGRLRVEIAEIQALNEQYRLQGWDGAEARAAMSAELSATKPRLR